MMLCGPADLIALTKQQNEKTKTIFDRELGFSRGPNSSSLSCLCFHSSILSPFRHLHTVKLGNKERFDKEQIGIKEPFPVTNLPFTS